MLNFGNKEFRNLQEQVLQNANDLETIKQSLGTALPDPIAGPQGPKGDTVIGPRGERGSIWTVGTDFPASPRESDLHLKNSEVYQYTNGKWVLYSSIKGSQGVQGVKGNTGDIGPIGPVGPRGEQGTAAPIYQIMGKVNDISQLPAPSTVAANSAYIVGNSIYGIVKGEWTYLTTFLTVNTASNISFTPSGFVNVQNVQGALENVISKVTTIETDLADEIARAEAADDNLDVAIQSKLDKDGYSALAHVGLADNIASPDGITQDANISFSPTGESASIADSFAEIKEIKGRTLIVNQLAVLREPLEIVSGITKTYVSDTKTFHISGTATSTAWINLCKCNFVANDKYIIRCKELDKSVGSYYTDVFTTQGNSIVEPSSDKNIDVYLIIKEGQTVDFTTEIKITNLTKMFGVGNEPTTVEEFNNLTRNIDTDTYNEGTLLSSRPNTLVSIGFNAFDGEIEGGTYHNDGGYKISSTNNFRSSDYISVVSGKEYTIFTDIDHTNGQVNIYEYDKNKNFLGMQYSYNKSYATFTLKDNTCYIAFSYYKPSSGWGTNIPTNAKIAFHLTHSGYRNGQYEPYVKNIFKLPEGVLNEPLRSAGEAYDSWLKGKIIKRINSVDLGTLTWRVRSDLASVFYAYIDNLKQPTTNEERIEGILSSKYGVSKLAGINENMPDKAMLRYENAIYIKDTSYTDPTAFKESLQGVILNYELAEPIITEYTDEESWDIPVSDFGTLQAVSVGRYLQLGRYVIFYMNNLRDKLRNLPDIPICEDTTGTSVLKCINGTYIWVKED